MLPGSSAECELSCYAQKSADYSKCQGYLPGSVDRETCFTLADSELKKCLDACGGGSGAVVLAGAALALYFLLG